MGSHRSRYSAPVRAMVVGGDRHALDHASDPRVLDDADGPPDIVMIPAARLGRVKTEVELDSELCARIRSGRTTLALDASGEGPPFTHDLARSIHWLLRDFDLPASRAAYLTQNRDFREAYKAWCGGGIVPVAVIEHDYYFSRFFKDHAETGPELYAARLAAFEARAAERDKRFVCLNFSPRTAKILLLLALVRDGLWDDGFISFPGFDRSRHVRAVSKAGMARDLLGLPGLEALGSELVGWLDALEAKGPTLLGVGGGEPRQIKHLSIGSALGEYDRSWFTIITETEVLGTRRVTEKPLKALANFSPFVLWGNPGSLAVLRGFDFRSFGGLVDEGYDGEADPARRFDRLYAEIRRLCALPQAALRAAERELADTLAFNARRALIEMPRIYREKYEPRLIDQLLDLSPVGRGR